MSDKVSHDSAVTTRLSRRSVTFWPREILQLSKILKHAVGFRNIAHPVNKISHIPEGTVWSLNLKRRGFNSV